VIPRLGRALPWALLILFGWRGLLAMRVDGATADEPRHLEYGARALASGTFLRDPTFNSKMPVSVLNALPVALAGRGRALSGSQELFLARLPSLLLGLLLGGLVWSWARELFGVWSGALALFLYTFCPNILAHSHLVTTDIATALALFAAAYAFWRYLEKPGRGRLWAAAAAFGLAQLTKVTALFLAPIFLLILALRLRREPCEPRLAARAGLVLLALGLGALVALNAGFGFEGTPTPLKGYAFVSPGFQSLAAVPVLREVPLPLPYAYVQGLDMVSRDSRAATWSYLRGRYSQTGFRSYFLWAFLVKVPAATQLLLLAAIWLWASGRVRAPGAEELLIVPVLFLLLYFSLFFRLDIGFRYVLPILPFLFVFTSRVAAARWRPAVIGAPLLWLAISSGSIHPHYLAYFNELAGGPANGWRWLIDSNLDWNQDDEYVRTVYARRSPVPVLFDPSGPVAGRIAVNLSNLVGRDPAAAKRHAWLRDNFAPVATIGYSWQVFDVTEADLARCCAGLPRAPAVDALEADLARAGQPSAGGDGVGVRFQERLNDGTLGADEPTDAARTVPPRPRPVRAWFGVGWPAPQTVGRVVAFPSFGSRGPAARKFLALDYVFQFWDGAGWRDIPGTRVTGNQSTRVEHRFPSLRTRGIRLLIERERDERGTEEGGFRAACLEVAVYER
jgi:4-amino-4-deoxy-L-arabinose transferase-like glycosyltransferase